MLTILSDPCDLDYNRTLIAESDEDFTLVRDEGIKIEQAAYVKQVNIFRKYTSML